MVKQDLDWIMQVSFEIPVFRPTFEEFKDFKKFIESKYKDFEHIGMAKIIPPVEWNPLKMQEKHSSTYDFYRKNSNLEQIKIQTPIRQYAEGLKGIYQLANIEEEELSIKEFKKNAEQEENVLLTENERKRQTEEDFQALEDKFWKSLKYSAPLYGADMSGNLFHPECEWNLKGLNNLLNTVLQELPGINQPYLYFGMWKAMFAWHVEDMNFASINYIHFGHPKRWYCIPTQYSKDFERYTKDEFAGTSKCSEFLRHKCYMISPSQILKKNIPVYTTVHRAGEFMVTYPYSYHAGFNYGFNCAESVNFCHENWFEFGRNAKYCKCVDFSARVNVKEMEYSYMVQKLELGKHCDDPECQREFCTFPRKRRTEKELPPRKKLCGEIPNDLILKIQIFKDENDQTIYQLKQ